jgi:hypothetical protein
LQQSRFGAAKVGQQPALVAPGEAVRLHQKLSAILSIAANAKVSQQPALAPEEAVRPSAARTAKVGQQPALAPEEAVRPQQSRSVIRLIAAKAAWQTQPTGKWLLFSARTPSKC